MLLLLAIFHFRANSFTPDSFLTLHFLSFRSVYAAAAAAGNNNPATSRELSFKKGDIIYIRRQIDKNWYEGEHNAMTGLLPVQYVDVSVAMKKGNLDFSITQL
jgi:hypothetical protein